VQRRIFDPFFTTKGPGRGTGLGLSISYGIIEKMGGTLTFTSRENEGTTFVIRLPIKLPEKK
jgi:two-component system NtrC family sensor kinase